MHLVTEKLIVALPSHTVHICLSQISVPSIREVQQSVASLLFSNILVRCTVFCLQLKYQMIRA